MKIKTTVYQPAFIPRKLEIDIQTEEDRNLFDHLINCRSQHNAGECSLRKEVDQLVWKLNAELTKRN